MVGALVAVGLDVVSFSLTAIVGVPVVVLFAFVTNVASVAAPFLTVGNPDTEDDWLWFCTEKGINH